MGTLQLMKEIDINGKTLYWSVYNKERVTPYTAYESVAIKDFNEFKPVEPSISVIKTKEL